MAPLSFSRDEPLLGPGDENFGGKRKEILYDGYYYDVTDWIDRHPGGKVIEFYTESGEDATCAIQQFHNRSAGRVQGLMKAFKKRPAKDQEIGLSPVTLERHRALTTDFTNLYLEMEKEGLFLPSPIYVIGRIAELLFFLTAGVYLMYSDSWTLYALGMLSFGLFMGRCGWLDHDGAHISLTGKPKWDRFLAFLAFGLGDGMSASWWLEHHNIHHAMPQRLERDVNLDTMPLLSFSSKCVKDSKTGKSFHIRHQATLFFLIDTFIIILFWKVYHLYYAYQRKNWTEVACMLFHALAVTYFIGIIPYAIAGWFASVYMIGNISLSHTHLPVTEEPMHWVEYGLVHTIDIDGSWWCDWWMGHLNYQIEHHLFPTLPPFRLPLIQERVKALAAKHNIPYICTSYTQAIRLTLDNLSHVSEELRQL